MKVFKLVLLLFITSASLVFGQEKRYFFKYEYHPNSKYLIKYKTDMDGGYKFVGSKEVIDKIGMNEVKNEDEYEHGKYHFYTKETR